MLIYVFDLDDTLLMTSKLFTPDVISTKLQTCKTKKQLQMAYHEIIKPQPVLNRLLHSLFNHKLIFTNSSGDHALLALQSLGIQDNFDAIINANSLQYQVKPMKEAYQQLMLYSHQIYKKKHLPLPNVYVFFDDRPENMIVAKQYGWITVYIGQPIPPVIVISQYMDFQFPTIENALKYFITLQNKVQPTPA